MELEMSIIAQLYISVSRCQRLRSIKEHSELLLFYTGELSQFYNSLSADSSPDIFVSCCLVFFALTFCLSAFDHDHKVQYRCDLCIIWIILGSKHLFLIPGFMKKHSSRELLAFTLLMFMYWI